MPEPVPRFSPADLLTAAMDAPNGVKLVFPDRSSAMSCQRECYRFRGRYKRNLRRVRTPDSPGWDATPWDELTIKIKTVEQINPVRLCYEVLIVKASIGPLSFEEI